MVPDGVEVEDVRQEDSYVCIRLRNYGSPTLRVGATIYGWYADISSGQKDYYAMAKVDSREEAANDIVSFLEWAMSK